MSNNVVVTRGLETARWYADRVLRSFGYRHDLGVTMSTTALESDSDGTRRISASLWYHQGDREGNRRVEVQLLSKGTGPWHPYWLELFTEERIVVFEGTWSSSTNFDLYALDEIGLLERLVQRYVAIALGPVLASPEPTAPGIHLDLIDLSVPVTLTPVLPHHNGRRYVIAYLHQPKETGLMSISVRLRFGYTGHWELEHVGMYGTGFSRVYPAHTKQWEQE